MRIARVILILVILVSLLPLGFALGAAWLAEAHGCDLHEGFVNPCVIAGADRGEALYTVFVSGWFALLTLPLGLGALVTLLLLLAVDLIRRRRRRGGKGGGA